MKILYHHRIASKDGQYVHIEEIINAFKELGHKVLLVEPKLTSNKEFGTDANIVQLIRENVPGFFHEFIEFCYAGIDFLKLSFHVINNKPDCIYERYNLFLPSGIWVKKLFRIPLILEVNAPLYEERKKYGSISLNKLALWTESYVWKNADYILPVTNVLADRIRALNISDDKIVVIQNGINKKQFSKAFNHKEIIKKYHLEDKLILGFVGFVRKWNFLDRFMQIIANNKEKNWHLFIIGDGPELPELKRLAKSLEIIDRITMTGFVNRDELPKYISTFDIALLPDVVEYASPLKLFEYMALKRAVLAPNKSNLREIVTDEQDIILFNPDEVSDFNDKLEILCNSEEQRKQISQGAVNTIKDKKLYWTENAKVVADLFSSIIA